MKETYVYYNHKYHPIYTDSITDYFRRVKNNTEDSLLSCFELFQLGLFDTTNLDLKDPLNPYNVTLSSATLSEITSITNKYLANKRIYPPVTLSKPDYYYKAARGNGKSLRDLYCFIKVILPMLSTTQPYALYISEYKTHDFKLNLENLYKEMIFNKVLNSYLVNNKSNQRNNTQEEINFFKLIATKNNTIRKIYK